MANEAACQVGILTTLLNGCLLESVSANETLDVAHCEHIFLRCLAWALGGVLDVNDRSAFDFELCMLSQALPNKASCSTHAAGSHALPASAANCTRLQNLTAMQAAARLLQKLLKGLPPGRSFAMVCGGTTVLEPVLPAAEPSQSLQFTQSTAGCISAAR